MTMIVLKVIYFIITAAILGLAAYLWALNRGDEQFLQQALTAISIGCLTLIALISFNQKEEEYKIEVPVIFFYNAQNLQLVDQQVLNDGKDLDWSTPPDWAGRYTNIALMEATKAGQIPKEETIGYTFYHNALMFLVFQELSQNFNQAWQIKKTYYNLSHLGAYTSQTTELVVDENGKIRNDPGTKVDNNGLKALLWKNPLYGLPSLREWLREFTLPPDTVMESEIDDNGNYLVKFKNPFCSLSLSFRKSTWSPGLGKLYSLLAASGNNYITAQYYISVEAKFSALRKNHPDMPYYLQWVKNIGETVKQFDHFTYWERLKEWRSLRATIPNRTVVAPLVGTPAP